VSFHTSCSVEFPSSFARFQEEGSFLIIMRIQKDGSSPGSILPFWIRKLLGHTGAEDNCPDFEAKQTSRTGTESDSMVEKPAPQNTL